MTKSTRGRFFEDFDKGTVLAHATPRTVTEGDAALYTALTGDRRPLHCAATVARAMGYPRESVHDLLVFHIVFGKTVADVSQNAVANLGYADVRFLLPVFPGDTLRAESEVLGSRETSSGKSGIVWVRTRGLNQRDEEVLRYCRWVMVEKRGTAPTGANDAPLLPKEVPAAELRAPALDATKLPAWATGGRARFEDYEAGERIHHVDGMTVEESDHMVATRLYQNTARVHFNQHQMAASRFQRRLVYGGHVVSLAYALAWNGLENAVGMLAWNAGSHVNPTLAGDTVYAFTDIVAKEPLGGGWGALRVKLQAAKNVDPSVETLGDDDPRRVLVLDCWLAVAARP